MFKIGYRTLKTAIGTMISIMIAQALQLDNFVSAGIITILCIQVTKKKSLQTSWNRFLACMVAILYSFLFFEGISYHPVMIGLLLLVFIPTVVALKAKDGVVTSSVIILHIYSAQHVTVGLITNEVGIILIGIGVALIMNLYMPSVDHLLERYQIEIEDYFKVIFDEIVSYLRYGKLDWDGKEITETSLLLEKAKRMALRDAENHLIKLENNYYHYFIMREKQFEIIERVLPMITSIPLTEQGKIIADFLEELSEHIHPGNTAHCYLGKLFDIKMEFDQMELPKTSEEFEARASLYYFLKEMEQYLHIKRKFVGLKKSKKVNGKRSIVTN